MMNKITCPFCKNSADMIGHRGTGGFFLRGCLCGEYRITEEALEDKEFEKYFKTDRKRKLFSGYLRNNPHVLITNDFIGKDLEKVIEFCEAIPLSDKLQKIEDYIFSNTTSLGRPVHIPADSLHTLFYMNDAQELIDLLKYLERTGFIATEPDSGCKWEIPKLTVEGYSKVESRLTEGHNSNRVFIACAFETDYQKALVRTIQEACQEYDFYADIVSGERHNDNISNKIIADIKRAKFVVADFTEQNNGVYFEAGYAMGMKKKVIRLIRSDEIDNLHFDTKQFNHIKWEDSKWEELKGELIDQIKVTIM